MEARLHRESGIYCPTRIGWDAVQGCEWAGKTGECVMEQVAGLDCSLGEILRYEQHRASTSDLPATCPRRREHTADADCEPREQCEDGCEVLRCACGAKGAQGAACGARGIWANARVNADGEV